MQSGRKWAETQPRHEMFWGLTGCTYSSAKPKMKLISDVTDCDCVPKHSCRTSIHLNETGEAQLRLDTGGQQQYWYWRDWKFSTDIGSLEHCVYVDVKLLKVKLRVGTIHVKINMLKQINKYCIDYISFLFTLTWQQRATGWTHTGLLSTVLLNMPTIWCLIYTDLDSNCTFENQN